MSTVQLRSAGSWLMGLRFDRQDMAFDAERTESFLRTIAPNVTINDALRVSNIAYRQWGVSFGYAYNWVPARHWLVSASLAPSIGYKYQSGESLSARVLWKNVENFHMDFIFRGALVHTNGRRYLGISTVNYLYDYRHAGFHSTILFTTFSSSLAGILGKSLCFVERSLLKRICFYLS